VRRFLVLYSDARTEVTHYAEGLIHYDGTVYLRSFYPEEGKLFLDIQALRNYLRDNEDIWHVNIHMLDAEDAK
jgi:hypothetical protein